MAVRSDTEEAAEVPAELRANPLVALEQAALAVPPESVCLQVGHAYDPEACGLRSEVGPEHTQPEWLEDDYIDAMARKLIEQVADGQELESHCQRLALLVSLLGMEVGLSEAELRSLRRGAYLHDIGKIGIPASILLKRGPLDEREWRIMQKHPLIGEQICQELPSLLAILPIIRSHHERWDGSGYPDGLRGEEIPLLARITQIADIYDALTTERPYKRAFTPEEALAVIKAEGERGWRDPKLVKTIENMLPVFTALPPDCATTFSLQALEEVVRRRSWL
jgi:putative two-component system response regulator